MLDSLNKTIKNQFNTSSAVHSVITDDKTIEDLKLACSSMTYKDENISDDVVRYILLGEPTTCVDMIESVKNMTNAVDLPGYPTRPHKSSKKEVLTALGKFIAVAVKDTDILRRFGIIYQACSRDLPANFSTNLPANNWFSALILFFHEIIYDNECRKILHGKKSFPTMRYLQDLASQFGQSTDPLFTYLFEPERKHEFNSFRGLLIQSINWSELAASDDFLNKLDTFSDDGRYRYLLMVGKRCKKFEPNLIELLLKLTLNPELKIRKLAIDVLTYANHADCLPLLDAIYAQQKPSNRVRLITVASRLDNHKPIIEKWLATEDANSAKKALNKLIDTAEVIESAQEFAWEIPPEVAVDTNECIPSDWMEKLLLTKVALMKKALKKKEEALHNYETDKIDLYLAVAKRKQDEYHRLNQLSESEIQANLTAFSEGRITDADCSSEFIKLAKEAKLENHPDIPIRILFRLFNIYNSRWNNIYDSPSLIKLSQKKLTDFRQIVALAKMESVDTNEMIQALMLRYEMPKSLIHLQLWPYFAEHQAHIDLGLEGLRVGKKGAYHYPFTITISLAIVSHFPTIPEKWRLRIYELAIEKKTPPELQLDAQQCAEKRGVELPLVHAQLASKTKDLRASAADWLARLNDTDAIPLIGQAIEKEKDIPNRAKLIASFNQLGGDLSPYLSVTALRLEAEAGLKKAPPKTMDWFNKEMLPQCYFQDGSKVDSDIIYWWVVLAVKLKMPQGNSLLDSYCQLLNQASQQALAITILNCFIAHDTLGPTDIEAHEYAEANKTALYKEYQHYAQTSWGEAYKDKTIDDAYQACFKERKNIFYGTAIKEKGMLCLIKLGNSTELLAAISAFMKNFFRRRAQIESMLLSLVYSDDPAIIQFLLGISRRYRTQSIQDLAKTLVTHIAERNHWTSDELADRTIQTAGLASINSPTEFEYGTRTLSISLGDDLKLNLFNDTGKLIKALPQIKAHQADEKESISDAKKWFGNCKKELKQVVTQQSERLQEAMISDRIWLATDWLEYLHQHPVMFRLLQRVLWQVQANKNDPWLTFRPTEDGDFIDLNDDDVVIEQNYSIRVLSANQLDPVELNQWKKHLSDYKIKPIFNQLKIMDVALTKDQVALEHHYGYLTDSLTLRGLLTKKAYKRGDILDAGFFEEYVKNFDALGVQVRFLFSGNCVLEENVPAAIYGIRVIKLDDTHVYNPPATPLADISPNLLNAIAIDYNDVASKCSQDPEWQSKIIW